MNITLTENTILMFGKDRMEHLNVFTQRMFVDNISKHNDITWFKYRKQQDKS